MKTCGKCKAQKAHEGFHRDARSLDGRHSLCKECRSAYNKPRALAWYYQNIARAKETRFLREERKREEREFEAKLARKAAHSS